MKRAIQLMGVGSTRLHGQIQEDAGRPTVRGPLPASEIGLRTGYGLVSKTGNAAAIAFRKVCFGMAVLARMVASARFFDSG